MRNLSPHCIKLCTSLGGTIGTHTKEETGKSLQGDDNANWYCCHHSLEQHISQNQSRGEQNVDYLFRKEKFYV